MNIITTKEDKKYVLLEDNKIAVEWKRGGWDAMSKSDYEKLCSSGMMWVFYPEAPDYWPL